MGYLHRVSSCFCPALLSKCSDRDREVALLRCHCGVAQPEAFPKAYRQYGHYLLLCTY